MQTSILLKIGITGMLVLVLFTFVALIMSLFGNNSLSNWISMHFDENIASLLLVVFTFIIVYPLVKKGRQKYLEDMHRNSKP
jgi:hypothetical protein